MHRVCWNPLSGDVLSQFEWYRECVLHPSQSKGFGTVFYFGMDIHSKQEV